MKKIYGDKVRVNESPTDQEVKAADAVLYFTMKPGGEGRDVPFDTPKITDDVRRLAALNPNLVVIFSGGNGFAMPWVDQARGLVFAFLGGQEAGNALANVISGRVNPSGRLPFTIEKDFADGPGKDYNRLPDGRLEWSGSRNASKQAQKNFPSGVTIDYREGIYVGYRWYEKKDIAPQFPFGFGTPPAIETRGRCRASPR